MSRAQSHVLAAAAVLLGASILGCADKLDLEEELFACESDDDCLPGRNS